VEILARWGQAGLDGLVNNAGVFTFWQTLTEEGFEMQWALNHLAPFLLTHELLPALRRAPQAKVVTVSSGSHYRTRLNWKDIQLLRRYNPLRAYKQTKLANVLFSTELNRRLGADSSIRAYAADPGLVNTDMGAKINSRLARWFWAYRRRLGIPVEESAAGIATLILDHTIDPSDEVYWKHGQPKPPNPYALDPEAGRRLWEISAQMCGIPTEV
jgi:NAD(P)-dependent dehydrogenase (short-subunit alcohol dehydrogenase family)